MKGKFVWVEISNIDENGEWLKVIREDEFILLCERKEWFKSDVYISKSDILEQTSEKMF